MLFLNAKGEHALNTFLGTKCPSVRDGYTQASLFPDCFCHADGSGLSVQNGVEGWGGVGREGWDFSLLCDLRSGEVSRLWDF